MSATSDPERDDSRHAPRQVPAVIDDGDLTANASAIAGIQRGLQGLHEGTGEDAEDAFASLERELRTADM